jgi:hypothetical protein
MKVAHGKMNIQHSSLWFKYTLTFHVFTDARMFGGRRRWFFFMPSSELSNVQNAHAVCHVIRSSNALTSNAQSTYSQRRRPSGRPILRPSGHVLMTPSLTFQLSDDKEIAIQYLVAGRASWHKSCRIKFASSKLERAKTKFEK